MRPCLCTHEFPPFHGGVGIANYEMAKAAAALGFDPLVLAPNYGAEPVDRGRLFEVRRWRGNGRLSPWGRWQTARALRQWRQEAPQDFLWLASYGAIEAALTLTRLGWRPEPFGICLAGSEVLKLEKRWWLRSQAQLLFKRADRVAITTQFVRQLLHQSRFNRLTHQVVTTPLALRTDMPAPVKVERDDDRFVVLTLARLHPRKGQLETARALATLPADLKQRLVYRVAGKGDDGYLEKVRLLCQAYGVPFESIGPVPDSDLARVYGACDLYCMTSVTLPESVEGFGMTFLEAGFYGKPSVGWRSGGIAEAVRHGTTGLLADEKDVDEVGRLIASLMRDPHHLQQLGEAAAKHARATSWDAAARTLALRPEA